MESRERMEKIVAEFQNYIKTYDKQIGYESYADATFINDILYGIGHSISVAEGNENYRWLNGYKKFLEEVLLPLINKELGIEK